MSALRLLIWFGKNDALASLRIRTILIENEELKLKWETYSLLGLLICEWLNLKIAETTLAGWSLRIFVFDLLLLVITCLVRTIATSIDLLVLCSSFIVPRQLEHNDSNIHLVSFFVCFRFDVISIKIFYDKYYILHYIFCFLWMHIPYDQEMLLN